MANNKLTFILFLIAIFVTNSQDSDNIKDIRILNYYHENGYIYSIERNEDNFIIITKEQIFCKQAPCIPPILDEKSIKNEEDCQKLKTLFDEKFFKILMLKKKH